MPLNLPAMNATIVCDGKELDTYDVKQNGTSSLTAFVAGEAGKVRAFLSFRDCTERLTDYEPPRNQLFLAQQFKIKVWNNLTDFTLAVVLFTDGWPVETKYLPVGMGSEWSGAYDSSRSIPPCKFHRQRVGTFVFLSSVQLLFDVRRKTQAWKTNPSAPEWGR
jgi:hypothetical protein